MAVGRIPGFWMSLRLREPSQEFSVPAVQMCTRGLSISWIQDGSNKTHVDNPTQMCPNAADKNMS